MLVSTSSQKEKRNHKNLLLLRTSAKSNTPKSILVLVDELLDNVQGIVAACHFRKKCKCKLKGLNLLFVDAKSCLLVLMGCVVGLSTVQRSSFRREFVRYSIDGGNDFPFAVIPILYRYAFYVCDFASEFEKD